MIIEDRDFRLCNPAIFNEITDLVINVDTLFDFMKEGGKLADPGELRIVPRAKEILDEAVNDPHTAIVDIKDCHTYFSVELKFYGAHAIKGEPGADTIEELKEYEDKAFIFEKNSTNFMWAPGFIEFLFSLPNLERVKILGVLSCKCVDNGAVGIKTFFDQFNKDIEVAVYADAIDTYDAPGHDRAEYNNTAVEHMKYNNIKVLGKVLK